MHKHTKLIKSIIGSEVYETLMKSIVKLDTKSVVDIQELDSALRIAPKSVVAFLMQHLKDMKKDEAKEIDLPWDDKASMLINKMTSDTYKGHISKEGKIIHEFDLCSIPQLSAHLLSLFEIYDEAGENPTATAPQNDQSKEEIEKLKTHIQSLETKINALIMLAAGQPAPNLKKAGIAPTMPSPPRPGVHSGSQKGVSKAGFHGPKTAQSDMSTSRAQTREKLNPNLKTGTAMASAAGMPQQPKQPKAPKISMTLKSENVSSKCLDCGEPDFVDGKFTRCACFRALSHPKITKSEKKVTMVFDNTWDSDAISVLFKALKKVRSNE